MVKKETGIHGSEKQLNFRSIAAELPKGIENENQGKQSTKCTKEA